MKDENYTPEGETAPTPEWKLPLAWATESGLPHSGILSLRYYSGSGMHLGGCKADPILRIALMSVVLAQAYSSDLKLTYKPTLERAETLLTAQGGCKYAFSVEKEIAEGVGGKKQQQHQLEKSPKASPR